jgi:AcrR family transcriptional regulator
MVEQLRDGEAVRAPQQLRSQRRVEQILDAAKSIIAAKGCAGLTIIEIAEVAGVTASSMYQYFPNKSAITHELAKRYLVDFRAGISAMFDPMPKTREELWLVVEQMLESFFQLYREDPVVRDIWMGTSVDKTMQDMDREDTAFNVALLQRAARPLFPKEVHKQLSLQILLMHQFGVAATRTSLDMPSAEARKLFAESKRMLRTLWNNLPGQ